MALLRSNFKALSSLSYGKYSRRLASQASQDVCWRMTLTSLTSRKQFIPWPNVDSWSPELWTFKLWTLRLILSSKILGSNTRPWLITIRGSTLSAQGSILVLFSVIQSDGVFSHTTGVYILAIAHFWSSEPGSDMTMLLGFHQACLAEMVYPAICLWPLKHSNLPS